MTIPVAIRFVDAERSAAAHALSKVLADTTGVYLKTHGDHGPAQRAHRRAREATWMLRATLNVK